MEFTIDVAAIRKRVAEEYSLASAEIAALGPLAAYQRSTSRHDERLAAAADAPSLACRAGCSWCCHFSVDVRPVEVFNILQFMQNQLAPELRQAVLAEIAINSENLKGVSDVERVQRNIKCAFLRENRCSIYAARPQTCRNYHATDATGCQQSFEQPDNLEIDPDFAPLVYQAGGAHVDAFSKAMQDAGYDVQAFELNSALAAAMADLQSAEQQFAMRQPMFASLEGQQVDGEFLDLED